MENGILMISPRIFGDFPRVELPGKFCATGFSQVKTAEADASNAADKVHQGFANGYWPWKSRFDYGGFHSHFWNPQLAGCFRSWKIRSKLRSINFINGWELRGPPWLRKPPYLPLPWLPEGIKKMKSDRNTWSMGKRPVLLMAKCPKLIDEAPFPCQDIV